MNNKDNFARELNSLIVDTFHNILRTELQLIKKMSDTDLSMREIHLIELVSRANSTITISDIAKSLNITLASVTVMVNKLADSGYLTKQKGNSDGRTIYLSLTKQGTDINKKHDHFHKLMIDKISSNLTEFEREVLASGVKTLNQFFKQDITNKIK